MYDIVIIGAGPAGASAAIFSAKAGKKTVVIDNGKSMTKRAWLENHYGIQEISGPDLVETGINQAKKFGADFIDDSVTDIISDGDGYKIKTENQEYQDKQILITTGVFTDLAEKIGLELIPGTEPRIKTVIKADHDGRTDKSGIWVAGTVAGVSVHTIVTAGHGAAVAINIISELNGERYVDHDVLKS